MSEKPFLSRWSQRKAEGRADIARGPAKRPGLRAFSPIVDDQPPELDVPELDVPELDVVEAQTRPQDLKEESESKLTPVAKEQEESRGAPEVEEDAPESDEPNAAEKDLPEVESLDYDSDYSGFMAKGVSERLRNRALRQLWRSNPILANVDGLNDYDEDFRDLGIGLQGLKTSYDAMKGFKIEEETPDELSTGEGSEETSVADSSESQGVEGEHSTTSDSERDSDAAPDDEEADTASLEAAESSPQERLSDESDQVNMESDEDGDQDIQSPEKG